VVSVSPASVSQVRAGGDQPITLNLTASSESQLKFDGTLQVRDGSAGTSAAYAKPLPLTLVIHDEPVPPDPGEAGKQTLEGIDSDGDGVRDDVQRWIILTYLAEGEMREAVAQLAGAQLEFLAGHAASLEQLLEVVDRRPRVSGHRNDKSP